MTKTFAEELAGLAEAVKNCVRTGNNFEINHRERAAALVREYAPSGMGFDNGTRFEIDASGFERLVFTTSFHHMDRSGMYDGWTDHTIVVKPTLIGPDVRVSGRNRNDVKDFISDVFRHWITSEVPAGAGV